MSINLNLLIGSRREQLAEMIAIQEVKSDESECGDRAVGRWIETFDVPFLLSLLTTPDAVEDELLRKAQMTEEDRVSLSAQIVKHLAECEHCRRKIENDMELDNILHGELHRGYVSMGSHA